MGHSGCSSNQIFTLQRSEHLQGLSSYQRLYYLFYIGTEKKVFMFEKLKNNDFLNNNNICDIEKTTILNSN